MAAPGRNLAWLAKHHFGKLRLASFLLCLVPALGLGGEWLSQSLGVNPLNRLLHVTGQWALILLTVTLAVTPVRRLSLWVAKTVHARYGKRVSDWNWLIRLRRQLGLFTFFYAALHLAVYIVFDAGPDLGSILDDVSQRPFIAIGFLAFALLLPLAATSNNRSMRLLGGLWRKLHTLSYLIAALVLAHFWMQAKVGDLSAAPYSIALGILLAARLRAWQQGERSSGVEVKER